MMYEQPPPIGVSTTEMVAAPEHASTAKAALGIGMAPHCTMVFGPTPKMAGGVLSTTLITVLAVAVLPHKSVAV